MLVRDTPLKRKAIERAIERLKGEGIEARVVESGATRTASATVAVEVKVA